jgi:HK97 gp10 family phage protein
MAKFKVKILGLEYVKKKLDEAPVILYKKASDVIYETAVEIEKKAQNRVPVDTDALRSSIRASKLSSGSSIIKAGLSNVTNSKGHLINYAAFVEFGTGRKPNLAYKILDNSDLTVYASTFKGMGRRKSQKAAKPYLFNSTDELLGKMVERIKNISI